MKLGTVGVDSGYLLIIDPCYIGGTVSLDTIKQASLHLAKISDKSCVIKEPGSYTELGILFCVPMDGEYQVKLVTRVDGVREIRIELDEEE